jgi:hypothetical protein
LPTYTDVSKGCSLFTFKFELLDSEDEGTTLLCNFGNNLPITIVLITFQNTPVFSNTAERYSKSASDFFTSFALFRLSPRDGIHVYEWKNFEISIFTTAFPEVFRDVMLCGRTSGF